MRILPSQGTTFFDVADCPHCNMRHANWPFNAPPYPAPMMLGICPSTGKTITILLVLG